MKKTLMISVMTAAALLAQEKAPGPGEVLRTELERINTTRFVAGVNVGPTVTGAPYSAEALNESIQTLYDGNRIVQKSTTKQYRDNEGRERREEGSPMNAIFITDPVAKTSYTLYPDTKTASKTTGGAQTFVFQSSNDAKAAGIFRGVVSAAPFAVAAGGGRSGNINVVTTNTATTRVISGTPGLQLSIGPEPGTGKVEDLGTRMMEGVQAKGTRATTIIPSGQIGNDRDIEVVDERWYSPELQLTIMTRHSDPRVGETTYKLTNIQRIEQVRSLFEIPSNYTIVTEDIRGGPIFRFAQPATPAKKEE